MSRGVSQRDPSSSDQTARMRITFRLEDVGCARAWVSDDGRTAELTATYVRDALGDLVLVTGWLVAGEQSQVRCSWAEEPGEYRWVLRRRGRDAQVRVLAFDGDGRREPDDAGRVVFETTTEVAVLGRAVESCARQVLDTYGSAGYLARWVEHPFPAEALERLHAALNPVHGPTRRRHGRR